MPVMATQNSKDSSVERCSADIRLSFRLGVGSAATP